MSFDFVKDGAGWFIPFGAALLSAGGMVAMLANTSAELGAVRVEQRELRAMIVASNQDRAVQSVLLNSISARVDEMRTAVRACH
jgi:hypothetical protein